MLFVTFLDPMKRGLKGADYQRLVLGKWVTFLDPMKRGLKGWCFARFSACG